ncbi:MAG: hypothetical protein EA357_08285 [Micavibrio sp.]|nr:MAG: hypothetical protein EA357_08285 [Micavibrio sp.]
MDRLDAQYMREMAKEQAEERNAALDGAGPLLDDRTKTGIEMALMNENIGGRDQVEKFNTHIEKHAGRNPDESLKDTINDALKAAGVSNAMFRSRVSGDKALNGVIGQAVQQREERIKSAAKSPSPAKPSASSPSRFKV